MRRRIAFIAAGAALALGGLLPSAPARAAIVYACSYPGEVPYLMPHLMTSPIPLTDQQLKQLAARGIVCTVLDSGDLIGERR